jgi:TorA-specific chaperone
MTSENQLTRHQWDDLLISIQQLCQVYWGPSDKLSIQMIEESFLHPFDAVLSLMNTNTGAELVSLRKLLTSFSGGGSLSAYLEEGYVRLFVNNRRGVAAPLYASCYEDEENQQLMGAPAQRMQRLLADLNIHIGEEIREPPDHLSIQLEVLYFLLTRQTTTGRPAALATAAAFVAGEMLPWVPAFQRRMSGETKCRFYPLITSVLLMILEIMGRFSAPVSGQIST